MNNGLLHGTIIYSMSLVDTPVKWSIFKMRDHPLKPYAFMIYFGVYFCHKNISKTTNHFIKYLYIKYLTFIILREINEKERKERDYQLLTYQIQCLLVCFISEVTYYKINEHYIKPVAFLDSSTYSVYLTPFLAG